VRSLRDNEARSRKGRSPKREPRRRLPASQGGRELGESGMVNPGEALVKAVMFDKPKMLTGLDQKGMWPGAGGWHFLCRRCGATGRKTRPNPLGY